MQSSGSATKERVNNTMLDRREWNKSDSSFMFRTLLERSELSPRLAEAAFCAWADCYDRKERASGVAVEARIMGAPKWEGGSCLLPVSLQIDPSVVPVSMRNDVTLVVANLTSSSCQGSLLPKDGLSLNALGFKTVDIPITPFDSWVLLTIEFKDNELPLASRLVRFDPPEVTWAINADESFVELLIRPLEGCDYPNSGSV